jgi:hypothetical protein
MQIDLILAFAAIAITLSPVLMETLFSWEFTHPKHSKHPKQASSHPDA